MGPPLRGQILLLWEALLLGLGLGLGYDLLRPPRYCGGRLIGHALDLLFGLLSAAAAFLFVMGAGQGKLGLWQLASILAGFLLYLHGFSPFFLPLFTRLLACLCRISVRCKKIFVQCRISAKKNFQKVRKCFIVKR